MSKFKKNLITEKTETHSTIDVKCETRKLRVSWSPELSQDLQAYYPNNWYEDKKEHKNLYKKILLTEKTIPPTFSSFEDELTSILSDEISKTIDRKIIKSLMEMSLNTMTKWEI